jgi:hypothetical protein
MSTTLILLATAAALGAVHTLAPDHWLPFAALGKARRLGAGGSAKMAFEAGLLHLLATAIFGLLALRFGAALLEPLGLRLESMSVGLLFAAGLLYAGYALARHLGGRLTNADDEQLTKLGKRGLYTLFALDPCVPLLPLLVLAVPLGAESAFGVFTAYALATLATMTALTFTAARGLNHLKVPARFERYFDATAGISVAPTAILMAAFA